MANKSEDKKAMDVAKPGKSTPDTSARPVLITHRPMVQDPMVKDDKKPEDEAADKPVEVKKDLGGHGDKVIQPISDETSAEDKTDAGPEVDASPEPGSDSSSDVDPDPTPESEQASPEKTPEEKAQAEEAAIVDATAEQAEAGKKKPEGELSPEEKAKQEALQKLITDKKYFVPIGQVSHRRNQRMLIIVVVVLLIIIGGYFAIDAGLVSTPITLPLDLIKN